MAPAQIQLLSGFSCHADGAPVRFGARSCDAVVSYLCLHAPGGVSRAELAEAIWPESDVAAARANLRKALQRIRDAAPELLLDTEDGVRLNADSECDFWRAESLRRRFLISDSDDEAERILEDRFALADRELLPGWDEEWVEGFREAWLATRLHVFQEYSRAKYRKGQVQEALAVLDEAVKLAPGNVENVMTLAKLSAEVRGPRIAQELLHRLRVRIERNGEVKLPNQIKELADQLERGVSSGVGPAEVVREGPETRLLVRLFESNVKRGGEEALELVAAEMYSPLCMRYPDVTLNLLRAVNKLSSEPTPTHGEILKAQAHYGAIVGDVEAQHAATSLMVAKFPQHDPYHIKGVSMKGYAYLAERNYSRAREFMARATELEPTEERRVQTQAQTMFLEMYEGNFEAALKVFEVSLAAFDKAAGENSRRNATALCEARAYLALLMWDWNEAVRWSQELESRSRQIGSSKLELAYGYAGVAKLMLGDSSSGLKAIAQLIGHTLENRLTWDFDVFMDCAAAAFEHVGRSKLSAMLLEANLGLRTQHGHKRAASEEAFLIRLTGLGVKPPESGLLNPLKLQGESTLGGWVQEELLLNA